MDSQNLFRIGKGGKGGNMAPQPERKAVWTRQNYSRQRRHEFYKSGETFRWELDGKWKGSPSSSRLWQTSLALYSSYAQKREVKLSTHFR
jgi:hypothetical protein